MLKIRRLHILNTHHIQQSETGSGDHTRDPSSNQRWPFVSDLVLTSYCNAEAGGAPEIPALGQQLLTGALLFGTS